MDFFDAVRERRSIRAFSSAPVETEKTKRILTAANDAPSAGNLQAYLAVNSVNLVPVADAKCAGCFLDRERHLYWTESRNPVQIEFRGTGHQ